MLKMRIGKQYQSTLKNAIMLYRHGLFEQEAKLVEQINGLLHPINCYSCLKRIEEKHILIENEGDKLRFHAKCIEKLVNSN